MIEELHQSTKMPSSIVETPAANHDKISLEHCEESVGGEIRV
jgi:hypothetical protein